MPWQTSSADIDRRFRTTLARTVLATFLFHNLEITMSLFLTLLSGIAWTIVYIDAIRVGFKFKTYAMPVAALGLNIAWESINAIHGLTTSVSAQAVINIAWAAADVVIVYTFFRFGRASLPSFVTRPLFIGWGAGSPPARWWPCSSPRCCRPTPRTRRTSSSCCAPTSA